MPYIDKEDLLAKAKAKQNGVFAAPVILNLIEKAPEADVVEVVRCKECAIPHNKFTGCPYLNGLVPPENHFCSYGKRKKGAEE